MSAPMALPLAALLPSEVGPRDRPEALLPCRVPNLDFDDFVLDLFLFGSEFDSDSWVYEGLELLFNELHHQARLSHIGVSDDNILEQE